MSTKSYAVSLQWTTTSNVVGNLGIGTNAPTRNLDIVGDIDVTGSLYNTNSNVGYWYDANNTGNITYSGNVGINTDTPIYPLDVNGDVQANNFVNLSDRNDKIAITTETLGSYWINNLRPCSYTYDQYPNRTRYGFIAQDMLESDFVEIATDGYYTLAMTEMIGPIVAALQECASRCADNASKVALLQSRCKYM